MGVLKFNGSSDNIIFGSLASPLNGLGASTWTCAHLFKRNDTATSDAMSYLTLSSNTSQIGCSLWTTPAIACDGSGAPQFATSEYSSSVNETMIATVVRNGSSVRFSGKNITDATAWTHNEKSSGSALNGSTPTAKLEIGSWNTSGDWWPGWIGLVGWWSGAMSDANVEALSANLRTSDWYLNAHGTPLALIQLNTSTPTDLIGNATSRTVNGTTLDAGETLESWNFDGTGTAAAVPTLDRSFKAIPLMKTR